MYQQSHLTSRKRLQSSLLQVLEVVERELQSAFDLGTAMAQNLCLCAEQHSTVLVVDVARLESRDVLQSAANIHLVATSAPVLSKPKLSPVSNTMRIGALPTLQSVQEDGKNTSAFWPHNMQVKTKFPGHRARVNSCMC
jgi:hypothetical protein